MAKYGSMSSGGSSKRGVKPGGSSNMARQFSKRSSGSSPSGGIKSTSSAGMSSRSSMSKRKGY